MRRVRNREKSDNKTYTPLFYFSGDGQVHNDWFGPWNSFTHCDRIIDTVGATNLFRVKPVYHFSAHYSGIGYHTWIADHGYVIQAREPAMITDLSPDNLRGYCFPAISLPTQYACNQRAFIHFSERFPAQISGSEFLQGFGELASLLPHFETSILRTIAGGFLNEQFGWENLLRDLKSLHGLLKSIEDRMRFLKETFGKPVILHYYEPNLQFTDVLPQFDEPLRGFGRRLTRKHFRCDYHATCTLVQRMSHIDDAIGWLRGIVSGLGLNNPLEAAWKVMPYSFVVDWFFNVSSYLARTATIQPADSQWDVFDVTHSFKWQCTVDIEQIDRNLIDVSDQTYFLGTYEVKQYLRELHLPVDLTVLSPSTMTPKQLVLLAAMIASRG